MDHRPRIYGYRTRWYAECTCGYRSTRRANEAQAAETAIYHVQQVMAQTRTNGVA
jgi:hypothetical protein